MSSEASPDGREIDFSRLLSSLLSDDTVRVFAPETSALGAALCLVAAAVMFWMGQFSAL